MTDCLLRNKRFFCREWAFSKVNHCLENRHSAKTCGALIMGGPGCGKSAICCELVWPTSTEGKQTSLNGRLLAYHFCQAHDDRTLSISGFINNLVTQLSNSNLVSEFKEKLENPSIRKYLDPIECERDPDEAFRKCILVPLLSIPAPDNTLFVMIDSIDESFYQSGTHGGEGTGESHSIAELLANHHHTFPHWMLLVCSSRKQSKAVTRMFTGFRKISLDDLRKSHVVKDVQQYILCRLDQEEMLRQHLSRETAEMLNQLHIKSNGCFLYLERVLDGVGEHFIILREIREIPGTLNGLFLWLCQRLFIRKQFLKIQPILNVILATQRPLTELELYECVKNKTSNLSREEFDKRLLLMSKILIDGCSGTKILFHHSFSEWLLDVKHCTQKYLCIAAEGHGMLALRLAVRAETLLSTADKVQEFAHHLLRSGFTPAVQNHHLVHLLLVSGANIEQSLCTVLPKDQKVVRLLLDAGAKMPTDEESTASSIHQMVMSETEPEDPIKNLTESTQSIEEADSNGRTLLLNAAYQGELQLTEALIAKSANIEAVDKSGQTALNLAARQGCTDVVSILLRAGACVNHTDNDGWTALRSAAWGGHTDVVSSLLATGAEVDHADSDQRTALRAAAWGGHDDIVLMLLTNGADVNKADNEGRTALIAAAYMGHTEIVEHLLDHNANINHEDCDGRTTLSVAALCIPASDGHASVVSLLLERGAEVDHRDHDGMTPLLVAAYEGHKDVCELLLEWDADVDHCDVNNRSPLLAAASMGHAGVVSQLLIWGAAVDTIDSEGRTVLSVAAAQGSVSVVQLLLDRGLDEMHRDNSGWTPLHMAAYEGHKEVAKALLQAGARVNEVDNDGRHALVLASQEGHTSVVAVLLQFHALFDHRAHDGKTSFRVATLECHKEVAHLLLCHGADINYRDADGRSTLYVSALENRVPMATYLLDNGADVEAFDLEGRTALHVASWQGHLEIVQLLVGHHANVNSMDNDQRTPIQSAAWQGHEKIVECFLLHGALVDHKCNQGATALCIAAQEGHDEVVRILLQYKANPNHADQFGRTAMRVAVKSGHTKVVRILEEFGASPSSASGSRKSVNSSSSSDTKPDTPKQTTKCTDNGGKVVNSCEQKPINGNVIHSPPSDSPDSTMDRRKSYLSNNSSSKSSSNLTSSNSSNNPGTFVVAQVQPGDLTFTQQLQQCSMPRNRIRPISRVLSPVSEPQTPVQSPPSSPLCETPSALCVSNIASVRTVPLTNKVPHDPNVNFLVPSPGKLIGSKTDKIAATINIYTNPNADLLSSNDEPVWQLNPQFVSSPNNVPSKLDLQRRTCPPDHAHPTIMGQTALELRSPELRRKRNGIVTNPKFAKSVSVNGYHGTSPTGLPGLTNGNQSNGTGLTSSNSAASLKHKGPARPNGLPLKKETPL